MFTIYISNIYIIDENTHEIMCEDFHMISINYTKMIFSLAFPMFKREIFHVFKKELISHVRMNITLKYC